MRTKFFAIEEKKVLTTTVCRSQWFFYFETQQYPPDQADYVCQNPRALKLAKGFCALEILLLEICQRANTYVICIKQLTS